MKRYYLEVRIREGDMRISPNKEIVEDLDVRETRVYIAIFNSSTGKHMSEAAFEEAVRVVKEITGK